MKAHPVAELFPMMTKDELAELAADIKANGLLVPIVVQGDTLIDGRNREAACKLAGVKPSYQELNGHDPVAFILSANIARRHLTKGQQAMAVAMVYPEPTKRGGAPDRGKQGGIFPSCPVDKSSLAKARAVLANAPEQARAVMDGITPLHVAHDIVKQRLSEAMGDEARLARIRDADRDLAALVVEGKITLAAADAELRERQRMDAEIREQGRKSAAALKGETLTHFASVAAAISAGERSVIDKRAISKIIEACEHLKQIMEANALVEDDSEQQRGSHR